MNALREFVELFVETTRTFDEWLTPDVMVKLIERYAQKSGLYGTLSWSYSDRLGSNWGEYIPAQQTLFVAKAKTRDLFKQQVLTVLHEIQHWNQHIALARGVIGDPEKWQQHYVNEYLNAYSSQSRRLGYTQNSFERDARAFAAKHLEEAMNMLGRHYGGKLEGSNLDDVVEELFDEITDSDATLSRFKVGLALRDHDLNTSDNMKAVIDKLRDLGVVVR